MGDFIISYGGVLFAVEQSAPGINPQFQPADMKTVENRVLGTNRTIEHYLGLGPRVLEFSLIGPGIDLLTDLEALQGPISRPMYQYPSVGGRVTVPNVRFNGFVGPPGFIFQTEDKLQRVRVRFKAPAPTSPSFSTTAATVPSNEGLPDTPTDLATPLVGPHFIALTWVNPGGSEGIQIQRSLDGMSGWATVAVIGPNIETYTDSGLTSSTEYFYQIRAFNEAGYSPYTDPVSGSTS